MKHSERSQERLARSLQMLAEIEAGSETPSRVEAAVMARWDAMQKRRVPSRTRRVVRGATAIAAGITIFGVLAWQRNTGDDTVRLKPDTTVGDGVVSGFSRTSSDQYTTVAVVGGPLMADEPIRVVRMRVARSVLGELGIPSPAQRGAAQAATVDIDVLVGEDGVARGVRVPISEL
jgi:hypothetical protein